MAEMGVALAIGNFDGVHRGHQALIRYALELASRHGLKAKAMTFEPHPAQVLTGKSPPQLTRLERKLELLRGISSELEVIVQPFDQAFSSLSPRQFVEHVLVELVRVRQLVVGTNFRFGRDRSGSCDTLERYGLELGFGVHGFDLSGDDQGSFSSSRIRQWIAEGEVVHAWRLLGRPHAISGLVVPGDGRGRTLDFATANLGNVEEQIPQAGVYAGVAQLLPDEAKVHLYPAAIHVGPRPTVERDATVEAHLLGYQGSLYDKPLRLHFLQRLRGLIKFESLAALKEQIACDVATTRRLVRTALPLESYDPRWVEADGSGILPPE